MPHVAVPPAVYLGIDPGASGGLACLTASGSVGCVPMPATEADVWWWVSGAGKELPGAAAFAVIEEQRPRPTAWFDRRTGKMQSSILKSTCLLYGNYLQIRGMVTAAGIPFEAVTPQKWQLSFGLKKDKGEAPGAWKNRLKAKAQQLFPAVKVTLATADALLIAEFCRRKRTGTL